MIMEYKGLSIQPIRQSALDDYSKLFSNSFQNFQPSVKYLNWLYFENPRGVVRGYDAYDGDLLVAHYACIPIKINGFLTNSLLSLNTATLPNYQGRGLFGVLARQTFEDASKSFANVIGVANSKSVGGFVNHLGFSNIGNLELRFGNLNRQLRGSRNFSDAELHWRTNCPGRPLVAQLISPGFHILSAKPFRLGPKIKAIVNDENATSSYFSPRRFGITLDWRLGFSPILRLPKRFKPSPLVLIIKPLLEADLTVLTSFSFPDFDAF